MAAPKRRDTRLPLHAGSGRSVLRYQQMPCQGCVSSYFSRRGVCGRTTVSQRASSALGASRAGGSVPSTRRKFHPALIRCSDAGDGAADATPANASSSASSAIRRAILGRLSNCRKVIMSAYSNTKASELSSSEPYCYRRWACTARRFSAAAFTGPSVSSAEAFSKAARASGSCPALRRPTPR